LNSVILTLIKRIHTHHLATALLLLIVPLGHSYYLNVLMLLRVHVLHNYLLGLVHLELILGLCLLLQRLLNLINHLRFKCLPYLNLLGHCLHDLIALYREWLLIGDRSLVRQASNELDLLRLRESLSLRGWEWSHVGEIHLIWLVMMLLLH